MHKIMCKKFVVPHGRGCFPIRNSVQAGFARHLVVLPYMESIVMASACAEGYVDCLMLDIDEISQEEAAAVESEWTLLVEEERQFTYHALSQWGLDLS